MQFYYQMNKNNFVMDFHYDFFSVDVNILFLDDMDEAVHKPAGIEELQGRIH